MRKYLSILIIALLAVTILFITSCKQEIEPEKFPSAKINFSYTSGSIHYVVGENVQFNNLSSTEGKWMWNFGDGATSTEKNPTHKYQEPGTYKVTLTVDDIYVAKKNILISDIVPIVNYTFDENKIVYNQTPVNFSVQIENPENKPIALKWKFPKGTTGNDIDENGISTVQNPIATFGSIGSQIVTLSANIEGKDLAPVNINVKVNYNQPAKTLYFAVKGGNIMAKKIIGNIDPEINNPFDFGYRSGKHPLNMQYSGGWLYVFDAGTRFNYVPAPAFKTAGDGEIFVVSEDGKKRETVVENFGGNTNNDFYYGYVDAEEQNIYWADRREGIFKTSTSTRNKKFSFSEFDYFVKNSWLGYYGDGMSWGNTNGTFYKYNGTYWWAKHSTGAGIFRFIQSDILGRAKADGDPIPEAGSLLQNFGIRSFIIDEVNQKLYFAESGYKFLGSCNLDGSGIKVIEKVEDDGEGGSSEALFVTSMAIDGEYLYWSYRGPQPPDGANPDEYYATNPNHKSGIKRIKLNDANATIEYFIENVEVYGIAIDKQEK